MIKAYAEIEGAERLVVGLNDQDLARLMNGQVLNLNIASPVGLPVVGVIVFCKPTDRELLAFLQSKSKSLLMVEENKP